MSCSVKVLCIQERSTKSSQQLQQKMCVQQIKRGTVLQDRYPINSQIALVPTATPANSLQYPRWLWLVLHTPVWNFFHFCCSGQSAAPTDHGPLWQPPPARAPTACLGLGFTAGCRVQNWGCWPDNQTQGEGGRGHNTQELKEHGFSPQRRVWEMNPEVQGILGKLNKYRVTLHQGGF